MLDTSIVYPMAAMVGFTILFAVFMAYVRIQEVRNGNVKATYFKTYDDSVPSRLVVKTSRHYSNLFEMPTIFYATCVLTMVMGLDSRASIIWAWVFVIARVLHAFIHVGNNKIFPRMASFFLGCLAIVAMWIQILRFL